VAASPLFSVAIPAYKDAALLRLALESVLSQEASDLEVVISDDSDSAELAAVAAAARDPRVRYVARRGNAGAAPNWNFCLEQCRGRYAVLLHHDERFAHSGCLGAIARTFHEQNAQVVVSALSVETGGALVPFDGSRTAVRRLAAVFPRVLLVFNAVGPVSTLALDEEARAVRFDPDLRWLVDAEYYARLFAGRRVRFCAGSRVLSRVEHENRITSALDLARVEPEERSRVLAKQTGAAARAFLRAGWAAYDAARALKRSAR